jgi:hypothetical protein
MFRDFHLYSHELVNQMVSSLYEEDLPMHNIAVLLFLDVVKWHNSESTTLMRYECSAVNKFWRIGYKIALFNNIPELVMPSSYKTPDECLDFLYVQKRKIS